MKKNRYHIINSWILLICFAAGQYMLYSHQHKPVRGDIYSAAKHQPGQIVTDKCQLCDAMHHNGMNLTVEADYHAVTLTSCIYKSPVYNFTSLALILSGGRAPPSTSYSV
ncbi:MAG: hypothetical protein ACXVJD_07360 [Mucilaginibacter sp.]